MAVPGVVYNSNRVIPAPFVAIQKVLDRREDGRVRRRSFALTVKGKLIAWKGSPDSTGAFWTAANYPPDENIPAESRLAAIRTKQGALQDLFGEDGHWFEIQPADGTASLKCQPRVKDIQFTEGAWYNECEYTISLEADQLFFGGIAGGGGTSGLEPDETWAIEIANEATRTYRVSHTVSSSQRALVDATGTIVKEGWQVARDLVLPALGQPLPTALSGELTGYSAHNYTKSEQVDEAAGRFSVTENWVYTYGQDYTEEFTVSARYAVADGMNHVSVEGTITGHYPAGTGSDPASVQAARYAAASAAFTTISGQLLTRAQNYAGVTLNPTVLSQTIGRNPVTGVVTYNVEWDDRAGMSIPGALSEVITVANEDPSDVFASLVVLGRLAGPVLQPLGTVTSKSRTVSIEAVFPPWKYGQAIPVEPSTDSVILAWAPPPGYLITRPTRSWVPRTGRYSRSVTFVYN
jgi:hypothetical protein